MQSVNPTIDFSFLLWRNKCAFVLFSLFIGFITETRTSHKRWCNLSNECLQTVYAARIMGILVSLFFVRTTTTIVFFVLHAPIKNTANVILFIDGPKFFFFCPTALICQLQLLFLPFMLRLKKRTNKYFLKKIIGLKKKKMENKKIKKNSLVVVEIVVSFSLFFLSFDVHK